MTFFRLVRVILLRCYRRWSDGWVSGASAALAFYALFSLIPLLLFGLSVAGVYAEGIYLRDSFMIQMKATLGPAAGKALVDFLDSSRRPEQGLAASLVSLTVTLWAVNGLIAFLRRSLNHVWGVTHRSHGMTWGQRIKRTSEGILVVGGGGLMLVLTHTASTVLTILHKYWPVWLGAFDGLWAYVPRTLTFALTCGIFALVFRILPDVVLDWRDVALGAFGTAVLFSSGSWLIGLYLEYAAPASSYGAAGSLVVLIYWLYWSAQLLLFGAELTHTLTLHRGKKVCPATGAQLVDDSEPI